MPDLLPRLIESADIAGTVTEEVAVQTGLAAGTWSINQVIIDGPDLDGPVFMSSTFNRHRYMAMENSATSAANLEWLVREFFDGGHEESVSPFDACCALAGAIEPSADDPLYHPYLYGAQQDGHARAGFYGIAGWHTKGHLVCALLEGVAFGHRQHIEAIRQAGAVFNEAVLSGGGSRSLIWPQIFADVLGVPVSLARSRETGAQGAAIAAGTGVGIFADFEAGATAMVSTERFYRKNVSLEAHYARRYALYQDIVEAITPLWRRLTAVQPDAAGVAA